MRLLPSFTLTLLLPLGFTSTLIAKPILELTDPGLPLQKLRPLDRRVYILTLEGKWNQTPLAHVTHYINFLFADGDSYSHKVDDDAMFGRGEVRCIIQSYQLARHGIGRRGQFSVIVSAGAPVSSATAPEAISKVLQVTWPMERQLTRFRVRSKYADLEPVDAFQFPGETPTESLPRLKPLKPAAKPPQ